MILSLVAAAPNYLARRAVGAKALLNLSRGKEKMAGNRANGGDYLRVFALTPLHESEAAAGEDSLKYSMGDPMKMIEASHARYIIATVTQL